MVAGKLMGGALDDVGDASAPDPGKAGDLAEFIGMLETLRRWSGNPSYRTLAKRVGPLLRPQEIVSQSTITDVFQPRRRRLNIDLVVGIVRALGLDEAGVLRWKAACVAVHRKAKTGHPAGVFRQLPPDLATFTGREGELARLLETATSLGGAGPSTVVISAIDGMAGVGKSALAVRAAHLLADRFPDGQLFLDLYGYTQGMAPRDPADALASMLASLDVPPEKIPAELDARAAVYRARLAGTRTLILLDNAAAEAQVRPLIPGDAGCLVLITSRKRLKALDGACTVPLDVLPEPDALALLRALVDPARAPVEDPGWALIAELCGCLPLALRIAAALIRHRPAWTLEHLADKLRAAPLEPGSFTDGERDLSSVFDLSYQTLDDDQRDLLRRLGLVPGSDVDAYAAAALLDTDPGRAERLLQDLVDHHLLTEPAQGRYRVHDLIRAYAHTQTMNLDPDPERERALGRLLHYYAHTAQTASQAVTRFSRPEPDGPAPAHMPDLSDPDAARTWLRTEHPNLDAAHTHAHYLDSHTVALAAGLAEILHTDGPWTRALELHHAAAKTAERLGQPAAHATALTDLGRVRYQTGDHPGAGDAHTQALNIYRMIGHRLGEATALTDLGRVRYQTGDHPGAGDALTQALEIYRMIGHRLGEATALTDLGRVRHQTGDHPGAGDALTQALEIYRVLGHRSGEATALIALGRVHYQIGDYPGAGDAHTRALEIHRALGHRNGEANALTDLGRVRYQTGDFRGAGDAFTEAMEIYRGIGHHNGEATALTALGRVRENVGDYPGAGEALTQALEIYRALGQRRGEANALTTLGRVRQQTGDHLGAGHALTQALEIYRETGERGNEAWALNHYAATVAAAGDLPLALTLYQQALEIFRETGSRGNEAWALNHYAAAVAAAGDRPRALALYQQALAMNQELNKLDDEAISLEGIADHHLATGETSRESAHLRQALELYQHLGMNADVERVQTRLAGLAAVRPNAPEATASHEVTRGQPGGLSIE